MLSKKSTPLVALCLIAVALSANSFPLLVPARHHAFPIWGSSPFVGHDIDTGFGSSAWNLMNSFMNDDFFGPASTSLVKTTDSLAALSVGGLAGFAPEEVQVTVQGEVVQVTAERETPTSSHHFSRTLRLPKGFQQDQTSADNLISAVLSSEGTLHLTMPKSATKPEPQLIKVPVEMGAIEATLEAALPQHVQPNSSTKNTHKEARPNASSSAAASRWNALSSVVKAADAFHKAGSATEANAATPPAAASSKPQLKEDSGEAAKPLAQAQKQQPVPTQPSTTAAAEHHPAADALAGLTEDQALALLRKKFGSGFAA